MLWKRKPKTIFKDYFVEPYKTAVENNGDFYSELESIYVSKIGVISLALLLDMDVKNNGNMLVITDPVSGKTAPISFYITSECLSPAIISQESAFVDNTFKMLTKCLPEITGDERTKKLSGPTPLVNFVLDKIESETRNGGDFVMDKFVSLIQNAEAKLYALRKEEYKEEKDIIYSAAARTLSGIMYKNCFAGSVPSGRSAKFYELIKAQLNEEFYLTGHAREQMVAYLGGPEVIENRNSMWPYIRQIQRIKDCPQMW